MIKMTMKRLLVLCCVLAICVCAVVPVLAENITETPSRRASKYFVREEAYVLTTSSGNIVVEFSIGAKDYMSKLGASSIVIQKKEGTSWTDVSTISGSTANGMLTTDKVNYSSSITYHGTVGKEYRAVVTLYAEDSNGSDSRTITTNAVTAK